MLLLVHLLRRLEGPAAEQKTHQSFQYMDYPDGCGDSRCGLPAYIPDAPCKMTVREVAESHLQ
jgi:hypothetical protein